MGVTTEEFRQLQIERAEKRIRFYFNYGRGVVEKPGELLGAFEFLNSLEDYDWEGREQRRIGPYWQEK